MNMPANNTAQSADFIHHMLYSARCIDYCQCTTPTVHPFPHSQVPGLASLLQQCRSNPGSSSHLLPSPTLKPTSNSICRGTVQATGI